MQCQKEDERGQRVLRTSQGRQEVPAFGTTPNEAKLLEEEQEKVLRALIVCIQLLPPRSRHDDTSLADYFFYIY